MEKKVNVSGFLWAIIFAIALGVIGGWYLPRWAVRVFLTFDTIFNQFLEFMVPLLIIGLIAPSIAELGKGAGRLLVYTIGLSYLFTIFAGIFTYGAATLAYPYVLTSSSPAALASLAAHHGIVGYFTLPIAPIMDIMTALVLAFVFGLGASFVAVPTIKGLLFDWRAIVYKVIYGMIVPLLPLYVLGVFMDMTVNGQVSSVLSVFSRVVLFLFVLTLIMLLIQFAIAGLVADKNPFKMLKTMMPAYLTALGTASSIATIPVTYHHVQELGVRENVAGFTVPLCASIHMTGSAIKIVGCALAILWITGGNLDFLHFMGFICMLSVAIVAGPGVPGGAVMAAVGVLEQMLGFDVQILGLIIALYVAMDSFGTACNVTGDGAVAVIVNKLCPEKK